MNAAQMVTALKEKFGDAVLSTTEFRGEQTLHVTLASAKPLLKYCRDELSFDYLVDISTLDHMGEEPRFEVVYELYGYGHHEHLRVRAKIPDGEDVRLVRSHLVIDLDEAALVDCHAGLVGVEQGAVGAPADCHQHLVEAGFGRRSLPFELDHQRVGCRSHLADARLQVNG